MKDELIQCGNPTNMLWKLFRLSVENEEVPEEISYEVKQAISIYIGEALRENEY